MTLLTALLTGLWNGTLWSWQNISSVIFSKIYKVIIKYTKLPMTTLTTTLQVQEIGNIKPQRQNKFVMKIYPFFTLGLHKVVKVKTQQPGCWFSLASQSS